MSIVYVAIGNSDDKLSQLRWAQFVDDVRRLIKRYSQVVHGDWRSNPDSPFQNACWCFEVDEKWGIAPLKNTLAKIAAEYEQDSIAWTEGLPEFIQAREAA